MKMQELLSTQEFSILSKDVQNCAQFSESQIKCIQQEKLFNLWVPKKYGGLESNLQSGLQKLYQLAKIDGSLGWTVTLCAGASYFIGNLTESARTKLFLQQNPILGGSGSILGTAEQKDENYILNGKWIYATGAPYLTHFTLNAFITKNGEKILDEKGDPIFRSFIIPKSAVTIIDDWNTMGMKATCTQSFEVKNCILSSEYSFKYNTFYLPQLIFKIPFQVFADLTLMINYLGMFSHFVETIYHAKIQIQWTEMRSLENGIYNDFFDFVNGIETSLENEQNIHESTEIALFQFCQKGIESMRESMIKIWPYLGIRASRESETINQIFRDFFTATQHHNFTRQTD